MRHSVKEKQKEGKDKRTFKGIQSHCKRNKMSYNKTANVQRTVIRLSSLPICGNIHDLFSYYFDSILLKLSLFIFIKLYMKLGNDVVLVHNGIYDR